MKKQEKLVVTVIQMLAEEFGCEVDRSELWLKWAPDDPNLVKWSRVGASYTTSGTIGVGSLWGLQEGGS